MPALPATYLRAVMNRWHLAHALHARLLADPGHYLMTKNHVRTMALEIVAEHPRWKLLPRDIVASSTSYGFGYDLYYRVTLHVNIPDAGSWPAYMSLTYNMYDAWFFVTITGPISRAIIQKGLMWSIELLSRRIRRIYTKERMIEYVQPLVVLHALVKQHALIRNRHEITVKTNRLRDPINVHGISTLLTRTGIDHIVE
jgi:hypothetical protein